MTDKAIHQFISYSLAAVWLINGLLCKVLNFVPRHQQIVAEILGANYSRAIYILIHSFTCPFLKSADASLHT